jgi:hypothetical protein
MVRDSRGSIGDRESGPGVPGPASRPPSSRWVRSWAPLREGSTSHGSCPTRPSGCPEGFGSAPGATVAGQEIKPRTGSAVSTPPVPNPGGDRNAAHAGVSVARAGRPRRPRGPKRRPLGPVAPHADGHRGQLPGPSASPVVGRVERRFRPKARRTPSPVGLLSQGLDPPCGASSWTVHQSIARGSDTSSGGDRRVRPLFSQTSGTGRRSRP